jgi:hypothetical protein
MCLSDKTQGEQSVNSQCIGRGISAVLACGQYNLDLIDGQNYILTACPSNYGCGSFCLLIWTNGTADGNGGRCLLLTSYECTFYSVHCGPLADDWTSFGFGLQRKGRIETSNYIETHSSSNVTWPDRAPTSGSALDVCCP